MVAADDVEISGRIIPHRAIVLVRARHEPIRLGSADGSSAAVRSSSSSEPVLISCSVRSYICWMYASIGLDTPLSASADFDGAQVAGADQGPRLSDRDIEQIGHIGERQEAIFDDHEGPFSFQVTDCLVTNFAKTIALTSFGVQYYHSETVPVMGNFPKVEMQWELSKRIRRPKWTDARLLVGAVLVVVAIVATDPLISAANATTRVWASAFALFSIYVTERSTKNVLLKTSPFLLTHDSDGFNRWTRVSVSRCWP